MLVAVVVLGVSVAVRLHADRPQPRPWTADPIPGPAATSFEISIDSGQCNPPQDPVDRVEVVETKSSVTVTAFVEPYGGIFGRGGMDDCLSRYAETVDLTKPLGDRELVVGD